MGATRWENYPYYTIDAVFLSLITAILTIFRLSVCGVCSMILLGDSPSMLIEKPNFVSEHENLAQKKVWQTPQCDSRNWKTPRLVALPFNETSSGDDVPGPENEFSAPS